MIIIALVAVNFEASCFLDGRVEAHSHQSSLAMCFMSCTLTSLGSCICCREVDTVGDQLEIDPSDSVSLLVRLLFVIISFTVPVGSRIVGILERNDIITLPVGVEFQQAF